MNTAEKWVLAALPVLAPAPTGYIVFIAFLGQGWFWPAALVTALALEILGYFSARLIMVVMEHNRTLSAVEAGFAVPTWRAWLPVVAYSVIALFLTFFLKMFPAWFVGSFLAFPFIGLLSAWVTSEFRVLDDYAERKTKSRADAAEERKRAKAEKDAAKLAQQAAQPVAVVAEKPAKVARQPVTDTALLRRMQAQPGESYTELAQHFGVSRTAITRRAKRLLDVTEQVTK
jgi:hypothetical protein